MPDAKRQLLAKLAEVAGRFTPGNDEPLPDRTTTGETRPGTPPNDESADRREFDFYGPRIRLSDRGLARFTDTPQKIEAFITSLGRIGLRAETEELTREIRARSPAKNRARTKDASSGP